MWRQPGHLALTLIVKSMETGLLFFRIQVKAMRTLLDPNFFQQVECKGCSGQNNKLNLWDMFRFGPVCAFMGRGKVKSGIQAESEIQSYFSGQCMSGSMIVAVYTRLEPPGRKQCTVVAESYFFSCKTSIYPSHWKDSLGMWCSGLHSRFDLL